jgi:hypothetical protein
MTVADALRRRRAELTPAELQVTRPCAATIGDYPAATVLLTTTVSA